MPPTVFTSPDTVQFTQVVNLFNKSTNIIAVVGAGISTSCGIPAFRGGPEGIYAKYGKHVFDYVQIHSDQAIGKKYLQMIGDMKVMLETAVPSATHRFLKMLADSGRLRRIYTQNIDDLEFKAGLRRISAFSDDHLQHKVVQLHGHLRKLFCGVCHYTTKFTADLAKRFQKEKCDIACPLCEEMNRERGKNKRQRPVGKLQTFVVLQNGGPNPDGHLISQFFDIDASSAPDLLLIMGTSLEIRAIRSFVSRLVGKNVPSILMDYQQVDFSGSQKLVYHLKGPCDLFASFLMKNINNFDLSISMYVKMHLKISTTGDDEIVSNSSDDSDIIQDFEPLPLKGAQINTMQGSESTLPKAQFILETCDHCFVRKLNCTWTDKCCDFCIKNGKSCTITIQNQKSTISANPKKRKIIKEQFVFSYEIAKSYMRPEEVSSLYCFPIRPDPTLFFEKNIRDPRIVSTGPRFMDSSSVIDFSDHDRFSVLGRTFQMCKYYRRFYSGSDLSPANESLSFGSIPAGKILSGDLPAFQSIFHNSSYLEKEKTNREIHHIHKQWSRTITDKIKKEAMFCNLEFFVSDGMFLVCKISYLSESLQPCSFNLFSESINLEPEFVNVIYNQIGIFGIIGKIQGVICADTILTDLIWKIYDRLYKKDSGISLYFSMRYQFQELSNIVEAWPSHLSAGIHELCLASELLGEITSVSRYFKDDHLKYPSYIHMFSIFKELLWRTNSITRHYIEDYGLNEKMTQLIDRLKSKIVRNQESYQKSCYFIGDLLDPTLFNIEKLPEFYSVDHSSALRAILNETCEEQWTLMCNESESNRLPTDLQFTLQDEVDEYWVEKDEFQTCNREIFWQQHKAKFPRLFILARKLLNHECFASYPPEIEIHGSLEMPVGKILDILSWKTMIDNNI